MFKIFHRNVLYCWVCYNSGLLINRLLNIFKYLMTNICILGNFLGIITNRIYLNIHLASFLAPNIFTTIMKLHLKTFIIMRVLTSFSALLKPKQLFHEFNCKKYNKTIWKICSYWMPFFLISVIYLKVAKRKLCLTMYRLLFRIVI